MTSVGSTSGSNFENVYNKTSTPTNNETSQNYQEQAHHLLYETNNGKPSIPISPLQFEFIQNSTIMRGKPVSIKRDFIENNIKYWLSLITQWENGNAVADHGMTPAELKKTKQSLQDCLDFLAVYKKNDPQAVIDLIKEKFKTQGECFLPTGWKGHPGHFMLARLKDQGANVQLQLMTKGGAAEFHQVPIHTPHKSKVSYRGDPISLNSNTLFESTIGSSIFQRIIDMRDEDVKLETGVENFEGGDLVGLINLFAMASHETSKASLATAVTAQRGPTCTDSGIRMTLYEAIFESDPNKNHKKAMYAFKLESLVNGFKQFKDAIAKGDKKACESMSSALQEHRTRLAKLYPEYLSDEELKLGLAIGNEIEKCINAGLDVQKELLVSKKLPPLVKKDAKVSMPLSPPPSVEHKETERTSAPEKPVTTDFSVPDPKNVTQELKEWVSKVRSMRQNEGLFQIYSFLNALPLPTGEAKDSYWDAVPPEEKVELIKQLTQLVHEAQVMSRVCGNSTENQLIKAIAYDIACQVAPSIPELKLSLFPGFTWSPNLKKYSWKNSEQYEKISQIKKHFDIRKERKKSGGSYYLFNSIVQTKKDRFGSVPSTHWIYASQFFTYDVKNKLASQIKGNTELEVAFLVDENQEHFPKPYYDLQKLAFLCNYAEDDVRLDYSTYCYHDRKETFATLKVENIKSDSIDENDVLFDSLKNGINKKKEDLLLCQSSESVQVINALIWGINNRFELHDKISQAQLEKLFFSYGMLSDALKADFKLTTSLIQNFLTQALAVYSTDSSQKETLLWLAELASSFESYIHAHSGDEKVDLPDFYQILDALYKKETDPNLKNKFLQHMLLSFKPLSPVELTDDDVAKILSVKFREQLIHGSGYNFRNTAERQARELYWQFLPAIKNLLLTSEKRNDILNRVLADLTHQDSVNYDWELIDPNTLEYSSERFKLNLTSLKAFDNTTELKEIASQVSSSESYREIFGNIPFTYVMKEGFLYRLPNETERIKVAADGQVYIEAKKTVNGIEDWYAYIPDIHSLNVYCPPGLEPLQCWQSTKTPYSAITIDKSSQKYAYQFIPDQGWTVVDPTTGKPSNERIVDLLSINSRHNEWKKYLQEIEPLSEIILKEVKNEDGSWSISQLTFNRLNLSFTAHTVDGKTRLRCDQFENYYLAPERDLQAIKGLKGTLLLEDKSGKSTQLIMPLKSLIKPVEKKAKGAQIHTFLKKHNITPTSSNMYIKNSDEEPPPIPAALDERPDDNFLQLNHNNLFEKGGRKYFVFHGTQNSITLKPENPTAALYLSLLTRDMGDFDKAYDYLKLSENMEPNNQLEWDLVKHLVLEYPVRYSPAAAAYDMHLSLRMDAHEKKHSKQSFVTNQQTNEEMKRAKESFKKHIGDQADYYFSCTSDVKEDINAIPADLRLDVKQESQFWSHFTRYQKQNVSDLYDCFKYPKFNTNESWSEWLKKTPIDAISNADNTTPPASHITRIKGRAYNYLTNHFFDLYNMACSDDPEVRALLKMDLFFLSRNDKEEKEKVGFLINVLSQVLHNHTEFKPVTLSEEEGNFSSFFKSKRTERKNAFEAILKQCSQMHVAFNPVTVSESTIRPQKVEPIKTSKPVSVGEFSLDGKLTAVKETAKTPFIDLFSAYFSATKDKVNPGIPFALERANVKSKIGQKKLKLLEEGHEANKSKKIRKYETNPAANLTHLTTDIDNVLTAASTKIQTLTDEINTLCKKISTEATQALIDETKASAKQIKTMTLDDPLLECFITQDIATIIQRNPNLTEEEVTLLFKKIAELLVVGRNQKIAEQLAELNARLQTNVTDNEKGAILTQIAQLTSAKTAYDIEKQPEYLVYEYATGQFLRKDQVEILDWIFNNLDNPELEHMLFQFQAGGGKTKVLMPILAYKIAQKGKLPVLINYNPHYEVGKNDLDNSLYSAFKKRLEIMEIELSSELPAQKIWSLLDSLKTYKNNKKCLVVKSESIYSLIIARKRAFENADVDQLKAVNELMDYLEENGVALIDEAHLTLDSLQETNQATGKSKILPFEQQQFFITITRMLAGYDGKIIVQTAKGPKPIEEVVRLATNQQALITDDDMRALRKSLIEEIISREPFTSIDKELTQEVILFLSDPEAPYPDWLLKLYSPNNEEDANLARLVVLAKKYLHQMMPHTLRLIQGISYGDSIHPNDFTCAPRHDKKIVTSKFQDAIITAALTVQNLFQSGLHSKELKKLLATLKEENAQQKGDLKNPDQLTYAQELFNSWWGDDAPLLDSFAITDEFIEKAIQHIGNNQNAIETFLSNVALPQIKIYNEKISATPPDLLHVFGKTISFTATPGLLELYPHQLQNTKAIHLDPGFEASVVQALSSAENATISLVDTAELNALFEQLYNEDKEDFARITSLIDSGGLSRAASNKQAVEAFLKFAESKGLKIDGAIFKDKKDDKDEGELALLEKKNDALITNSLVGSDLPSALQKIGKKFNEILLFTLFGLEDTTGADYKQPDKGKALLTVGEMQTLTKTIQSAMRMRRLLLGESGQTIRWVILNELAAQIPAENLEKLTVKELLAWMIENEAKIYEKTLAMRAFQGIHFLIQKIGWDIIYSKPTAEEQIATYLKFRNGLVDFMESDPFLTYAQQKAGKTEDVLRNYALSCYKKLGFTDTQLEHLVGQDKKDYEAIIKQTSDLIESLTTSTANQSSEMHQHQEARQEQHQENRQEVLQQSNLSTENLRAKRDEALIDNLWDKNYITPDSFTNMHQIFDFIPEDMFLSKEFMQILEPKSGTKSSDFKHPLLIRPFRDILVIKEKDTKGNTSFKYIPCTKTERDHLVERLEGFVRGYTEGYNKEFGERILYSGIKQEVNRRGISRKAILVNLQGKIIKNGDKNLGFDEADLKELENAGLHKRLTLLAFLNGKIQNLSQLNEITKDWDENKFDAVWKAIIEAKIGGGTPDYNMMHEFKRVRRWEKGKIQRHIPIEQKTTSQAKPHTFQLHTVYTRKPNVSQNQSWFSTVTSWFSKKKVG